MSIKDILQKGSCPSEQEELITALQKLEDVVKNCKPKIAQGINKGNSVEKIQASEKLLNGLYMAEDLKVLYRWFNGSSSSYKLFDFPSMWSLDEAIEYLGEYESKAWLIIGDGGGENALISPLSEKRQISSPIYRRDMWQRTLVLEHQSILAMVYCFIECYETDVITDNFDCGYVLFFDEKFDEIRLKYSPNAYYFDEVTQTGKGEFYCLDDRSYWHKEWLKYV